MKKETYKNFKDLKENEKLFAVATLSSLKKEKTLEYHDLFLNWQDEFEKMSVPIVLMTQDSQEELDEIKDLYHSRIYYYNGENESIYKKSIKQKFVFGEMREAVQPYMTLFDEGKAVIFQKRINSESIKSFFKDTIRYRAEKEARAVDQSYKKI